MLVCLKDPFVTYVTNFCYPFFFTFASQAQGQNKESFLLKRKSSSLIETLTGVATEGVL